MRSLDAIVTALRRAQQLVVEPGVDVPISGVTDDSRRVSAGTLFCAIDGTAQDGHSFVAEAGERGAGAAVVARAIEAPIPQVQVRDSRQAAGIVAAEWYGRPAESLEVTGVTGTNGKTTTVALLRHLLNAGGSAGSVGTLGAMDGSGQALSGVGNLTTPGPIELHRVLAELRDRGVRTVAIEASSHALDQQRLASVGLRGAIYTNLSHEHLDYHGTMEAYRDAKARLSDLLAPGGTEVVNEDDPAWRALGRRDNIRRIGFGRSSGEVRVHGVHLDAAGASAVFVFDGAEYPAHLPLLGDFNVENALAAATMAWAMGLAPEAIVDRLTNAPSVPGRLEPVASGDFLILRDYCHTPDALERAMTVLQPITPGRLVVLFGAGGDRDPSKRAPMGQAVAGAADLAIVTSDNPRTEDPDRIIDEVESGMGGTAYLRITDRLEAIDHAIGLLKPGDCLLLAGKGHEDYQVVGTERRPFDEREIVQRLLRDRGIV
jgi:UDP-N-acetylmuramoyl-L-alanyl-D-glutamate--2,6-diaminopimelate ligase